MLPNPSYQKQKERLFENMANMPCRLALYGPHGTGLTRFADSFLDEYKMALAENSIYCYRIACERDNKRGFFLIILRELLNLLKSSPQVIPQENLRELEKCYEAIFKDVNNEESYEEQLRFTDAVRGFLHQCGKSLTNETKIWVIILDFDNIRKLFHAESDQYAKLLLDMSDLESWFGMVIASHRTTKTISELINCSTSFAAQFGSLTLDNSEVRRGVTSQADLAGYSPEELETVYRSMAEKLGSPLSEETRQILWDKCGSNPQRLEIIWEALDSVSRRKHWSEWDQSHRLEAVLGYCGFRMNEQLDSMVRCIQDVAPRDSSLSLYLSFAEGRAVRDRYNAKENYLRTGLLLQDRDNGRLLPCVPAILDRLRNIVNIANIDGGSEATHKTIRILHLSDLHFKEGHEQSTAEIQSAYLTKLKNKFKEIGRTTRIDYVCISGDLAHSGKAAEYRHVKAFLHEISERISVPENRFLLCPGNHDQNVLESNDIQYPETQAGAKNYLNIETLSERSKSFHDYEQFCADGGYDPYFIGGHKSFLVGVRECTDFIVVCLNTAWCSIKKNLEKSNKLEAKPAWVGQVFADAIYNRISEIAGESGDNDKKPVLTLMHHPSSEWVNEEQRSYPGSVNVWKEITGFSNYILCGHTHEIGAMHETVDGASVFHGGWLYENNDPTYENCFYIYTFPVCNGDISRKEKYIYHDGNWHEMK